MFLIVNPDFLGVFAELSHSISDATQFYRRNTTDKLFWSQYLSPNYPVPFVDQLKQLIELHKAAELAMKDLIIRLWPAEPIPSNYFGLVKRLVSTCPRLEVFKTEVNDILRHAPFLFTSRPSVINIFHAKHASSGSQAER